MPENAQFALRVAIYELTKLVDRGLMKDQFETTRALVADGFSPIKYDADKPEDVLAEDKVIGSLKLGIASASVRITPAAQAYAE